MTKEVHLVFGTTGEYSDRSEWLVGAFSTVDAAQNHIEALTKVYHQFDRVRCGYNRKKEEMTLLAEALKELDPSFREDYTGTAWYYESTVWRG